MADASTGRIGRCEVRAGKTLLGLSSLRRALLIGGLSLFPLAGGCQCIVSIPPFPEVGGDAGAGGAGGVGGSTATSSTGGDTTTSTQGTAGNSTGGTSAGGAGGGGGSCLVGGECMLDTASTFYCNSDVTGTLTYQGSGTFDFACVRLRPGHALDVAIADSQLPCLLRGGYAPGPPDPDNPVEVESNHEGIAINSNVGTVHDLPLGDACVVPIYCDGDSKGAVVFVAPACQ